MRTCINCVCSLLCLRLLIVQQLSKIKLLSTRVKIKAHSYRQCSTTVDLKAALLLLHQQRETSTDAFISLSCSLEITFSLEIERNEEEKNRGYNN